MWNDIKFQDDDDYPTLDKLHEYETSVFNPSAKAQFSELNKDINQNKLKSIADYVSKRSNHILSYFTDYELELDFDEFNVEDVITKIQQHNIAKTEKGQKELQRTIGQKLMNSWVFHTEISIIPLAQRCIDNHKRCIDNHKLNHNSRPIIALFSKNEVCWRCQIFLQALANKTGSKVIILSRHKFDRSMRAIKEQLEKHKCALKYKEQLKKQLKQRDDVSKLLNDVPKLRHEITSALKEMCAFKDIDGTQQNTIPKTLDEQTTKSAINHISKYDKLFRCEIYNHDEIRIAIDVINPDFFSTIEEKICAIDSDINK